LIFDFPLKGMLLVGVVALLGVQLLMARPLPDFLHRLLKPFGACVLEIYFLHSYLFVHPSGVTVLDLTASFAVILLVSVLTHKAAEKLQAGVLRPA
jgi:hypothetical protein